MKIFCGGDFLYWIQNAHIHYFTLKILKNIMKKPSYDLICGDETIKSIFKIASENNDNYKNDYDSTINFLKQMEFYRFLPTPYNIKHLTIPGIISFLKYISLYNIAKRIYHKFK